MLVSLNINDRPVGYSPPVGPAVGFTVRYNQRDMDQPQNFTYSNFGSMWTFDWLSYITDIPSSPYSDVAYYIMGGGTRTFTDFDSATQTYAFQQYDQTKLTRTAPATYEMLSRDGSRKIFSQSDGSIGTTRKVFLTQLFDPFGNAVSLTYDTNLRIVAITDAIGQVTTIAYQNTTDMFKITRVTDPFGRFATFDYDTSNRLIMITDVIGISSQFTYDAPGGDFITTLTTPYGVTSFTKNAVDGNTRSLETLYPDGNSERVEYNQTTTLGIVGSDPQQSVPGGMATTNKNLFYRNTFYWSKKAFAAAYPDYTKAKIYHWLHTADLGSAAGILESTKEPLEGRVWYDYAGQSFSNSTVTPGSIVVGSTNQPTHVGRVLDDGFTQLSTYAYDDLGNVTEMIDPVGRMFSATYAANGIDLLQRWAHGVDYLQSWQLNELLSQMTYNAQHLPLTSQDAAGQTTTNTYNARGQVLTWTNAKNETTTYSYDANGYLTSIDGPLPGATITFTYDSFGRVRTKTDESGYTLTFDYDALDRRTKITFPDATFEQFTYTYLDQTLMQDRAGRQTTFEYNAVQQMTKRTDPLNRVNLYQWCACGDLRSLTDPMGRSTNWRHDVQGRVQCKEYADGSKFTYLYENTTSRLRQRIDEQLQVTQYTYNRDDTVRALAYTNATVATPPVAFTYDANYSRLIAMTDGTGTTQYRYIPITPVPSLGAGQLARVDGPLGDAITFGYDELGRRVSTTVNGVASMSTFDAAGRMTNATNALGTFSYTYDGNSPRVASQTYPNGQTAQFSYASTLQDQLIERITYTSGTTPISEFVYGYDVPTGQITSWSQQANTQTPSNYSFAYDPVDQLTAASVAAGGSVVNNFSYSYDPAGNRLTEQVDATTRQFSYNALNELTTVESDTNPAVTYNWDAEHRLSSIWSEGASRIISFTYDGLGRCVGIRLSQYAHVVSNRHFLWCDNDLCEERTTDRVSGHATFLHI